MSSKRVRVGVVGLGKMGLLHAGVLNILPDVELTAICEKSSLIRKMAKKAVRGVSIVGDIGAFAGLGLDAVYVTTPTSSHYSIARRVYEEGLARHVFVEKPLTSKYAESKQLCELAERCGGVNMVGYLRRFMVTFMKTRELLLQGVIGDPVSFSVKAFSSDFFGVKANSKAAASRGGVLSDLGSYAVDLSLWFFGQLIVDSAKVESLSGSDGEDSVCVNVQSNEGVKGEIFASWNVEGYRMPEVGVSLKGREGLLEANDDKVVLSLQSGEKTVCFRHDLNNSVGFWLGLPEYYHEDAHFVASVKSGVVSSPSFREASDVDQFIDVVRERVE